MIDFWLQRLPPERRQPIRKRLTRLVNMSAVALFVLLGTLALTADRLVAQQDQLDLRVGAVASEDILAPGSLTYNSDVLTQQVRQDAIERVDPVYDPNPDVTRQQIRLARNITNYINAIRHDIYASTAQQIEDLLLIEALTVNEEQWQAIVGLPDARWDLISNEISALVERTMQQDIRPDRLDAVRSTLLNSVASRFSNSEAEIIVAISEDVIQPNTFFNEEATVTRQTQAAQTVPIQERSFEQGQLIVRAGSIVTDLDMEALRQFNLLQEEGFQIRIFLGSALAMVLVTVIFAVYLDRFYPKLLSQRRILSLLGGLFLIFLALANLFGPRGFALPYLYPSATLGLLLTSLATQQFAILAMAMLATLVGIVYGNENALEMMMYILVGGIFGILSLQQIEKIERYFFPGVLIGLGNVLVILVFASIAEPVPDLDTLLLRGVMGMVVGVFSPLFALGALYFITGLYNLPTSVKLDQLIDSKQELLKRLLREAPGTYQHSLQVANLSELAAQAIGANAQLVRVAAMYHDIGKTLNPLFFVENTTPGINPHNDLNDPHQSAKVIIGHVIEGDKMARRANLPQRIRDFILEHHGTTQVLYFYTQAIEQAGEHPNQIDIRDFTYPGPAPRSRETGIMMLADGCESATRSRRPSKKQDIEDTVNHIFELRLSEGQLDNSGLTLNEIKIIRHTFIETLQAMYHPRIEYKSRQSKLEKPTNKAWVTDIDEEPIFVPDDKIETQPLSPVSDVPILPASSTPSTDSPKRKTSEQRTPDTKRKTGEQRKSSTTDESAP